jgi:hypothetical protein
MSGRNSPILNIIKDHEVSSLTKEQQEQKDYEFALASQESWNNRQPVGVDIDADAELARQLQDEEYQHHHMQQPQQQPHSHAQSHVRPYVRPNVNAGIISDDESNSGGDREMNEIDPEILIANAQANEEIKINGRASDAPFNPDKFIGKIDKQIENDVQKKLISAKQNEVRQSEILAARILRENQDLEFAMCEQEEIQRFLAKSAPAPEPVPAHETVPVPDTAPAPETATTPEPVLTREEVRARRLAFFNNTKQ